MPGLKWTDEEILEAFEASGRDVSATAAMLETHDRVIHGRIRKIEDRTGVPLRGRTQARVVISRDLRPNPIDLEDGAIIVASDAHYWPGDASTAHRAMLKVIKQIGPQIVLMNGDEFDGASISRHGRIGWEQRPSVAQEISALQDRMQEIARAAGSKCHLLGSYGNHTYRWDNLLSARVPEVENVPGMKFDDLLPRWNYAWAWMVNGHTLIKHRLKGGIHATWNNTGEAQVNTVTGHLHNLRITPRTTMSPLNGGQIYGVDCGMLADPWGPQFGYVEQGPRNWRSGFIVLTFSGGLLMPPEICQVVSEDVAWFRGNRMEV